MLHSYREVNDMARKSTDAQIRAHQKYNAKATKQVPLRFNLKTDADIVATRNLP